MTIPTSRTAGMKMKCPAVTERLTASRRPLRLAHLRIDAHGRIESLVERLLHKLGW